METQQIVNLNCVNNGLIPPGSECKKMIEKFECPYCGHVSNDRDNAYHHVGMCHLATLIDKFFLREQEEWLPPKPFNKFNEWSSGDRHEFCRRLDTFIKKFYLP